MKINLKTYFNFPTVVNTLLEHCFFHCREIKFRISEPMFWILLSKHDSVIYTGASKSDHQVETSLLQKNTWTHFRLLFRLFRAVHARSPKMNLLKAKTRDHSGVESHLPILLHALIRNIRVLPSSSPVHI
jgi:hypothetical protein